MKNYLYTLEDLSNVKNRNITTIDLFSGGGGSSIGAKMSGITTKLALDIDEKQMKVYKQNIHAERYEVCDIREFNERLESDSKLRESLTNVDIGKGSFPCTPFSNSNNSKKDISSEKIFREGQKLQRLDDLALETIRFFKLTQPKTIVMENVAGLMNADKSEYVSAIYTALDEAGYGVTHKLLDASTMGVPQRRRRVFFFGVRKDLSYATADLFGDSPAITFGFNEKPIPYSEIEEAGAIKGATLTNSHKKNGDETQAYKYWKLTAPGRLFKDAYIAENKKAGFMDYVKIDKKRPLPTITAHLWSGAYHYNTFRSLTKSEIVKASSFPLDYDFLDQNPKYVCGMSVPPLMMHLILEKIVELWIATNQNVEKVA